MSTNADRFEYDASAVALGGSLTRPFSAPLHSQASSVLSTAGGYASARADDFRFEEIVSFRTAYTEVIGNRQVEVSGDKQVGVRETSALAVVEGLNIRDVVTADRIVAKLYSQHRDEPGQAFRMAPVSTYVENLRIDGCLVALPHPCRALVPRSHLVAREDAREARSRSTWDEIHALCKGKGIQHDFEGKPFVDGADRLRITLFDVGGGEAPEQARRPDRGSVFDIPGFGTVAVGVLTVERKRVRLEILRIDLHSPVGGVLVVAAVQGNGDPY